jgi:hypothetical protein
MKITDQIKQLGQSVKNYIEAEKELIKLKAVKNLSMAAAILVTVVFLIILFHIMLAMAGIWLGFYLGTIWESYPLGFGVSALAFVTIFILVIIFRKPLLINPIVNAAIGALVKDEKLPEDEDKEL